MEQMQNNYEKNILKETFNVKSIYTIHYFKYGKNFSCATETHDFWELIYIDSGTAEIIVENNSFLLKQGQAYFYKPNVTHSVKTNNDFANSVIVSFDCNSKVMHDIFANKIFNLNEFEKQLLNKVVFEGKLSYNEKLNDIYLSKMTKRVDAPFAGEQLIKNSIELLLISIARGTFASEQTVAVTETTTNSTDKIVSNILMILNKHVYDKISLDTIAKKMAFSKTYIKSVFKKKTGTSIIQYYINLKIEEAKKLISQNKFTVTEISLMLNFSSVHYFSRQFKLITDMSPTEYENSIKADNVL